MKYGNSLLKPTLEMRVHVKKDKEIMQVSLKYMHEFYYSYWLATNSVPSENSCIRKFYFTLLVNLNSFF